MSTTRISTTQTSTRLGSNLPFVIVRMHGRNNFPEKGLRGYVFLHKEDRYLPQRYSGIPRQQKNNWVVRSDARSGRWRIDRHIVSSLFDCVPDLSALFDSAHDAALALERYLNRITVASL